MPVKVPELNRRTLHVLQVSAIVVLAPLAGLLVTLEPGLLLLVPAAIIVVLAFEAPVAVVGLAILLHIATPVYMKVPIPGFFDPPVSTALLVVVVAATLVGYLARSPLPPPLARDGRRLVGAFVLFSAVLASSLASRRTGTQGIETWLSMFAFPGLTCAMTFCVCRGTEDVRRLTAFLLSGGVLACVYALIEYALGRNPLLEMFVTNDEFDYWSRDELGGLIYRCFSFFDNPLQFGMITGMIFPFAAVRTALAEKPGERALFAGIAGLLALGVVLTFSRGPLLGLMAGSIVTALIYRRFRPWLAAAALAALAVLFLAWSSMGTGLVNRMGDVDNMTLRLKLWQTAIAIFSENPLRGIGIGNFSQYYLEAIREGHIGPFHEFGPDRIAEIRVAENTYLQIAAETGIIGLLTGTAAVLSMFYLCLSVGRSARDPRARGLAVAIGISAVVYLVNGLFVTAYTFYFGTLLFLGFLPGALLVLDRDEERRDDAAGNAEMEEPGPAS